MKSARVEVLQPGTTQGQVASQDEAPNGCPVPQLHAKHDLVVWFEVLELGKILILKSLIYIRILIAIFFSFSHKASSGDYVPVMVDHSDELPCRGVYFLHHGLQRRIRVTLVHDKTSDLKWKDVRELVVGRIRFENCYHKQ